MMSHFANVSTILEYGLSNDSVALAELFYRTDPEVLADDFCYLLISLFAKLGDEKAAEFKEFLLKGVTDHELEFLQFDLQEE
jgi:hypothetical protein